MDPQFNLHQHFGLDRKTYEKTGKLPQTSNKSSMGMMLIGLVTLLLSLGLVVINRFTI